MSIATVGRRSTRTFGILATVSAALPLGLVGCASAPGVASDVTELHVSAESDVLALPTQRTYDVTEASLIEPRSAAAFGDTLDNTLGDTLDGAIESTGYLVLSDGTITEAKFSVTASEHASATFVLTEPAVLARGDGTDGTVTAIGTLSFDGRERPNTGVKITPVALTEESAELDVRLELPDSPLAAGAMLPFDEVAAHFSLAAR